MTWWACGLARGWVCGWLGGCVGWWVRVRVFVCESGGGWPAGRIAFQQHYLLFSTTGDGTPLALQRITSIG